MTAYVFDPQPEVTLPVTGTDAVFPVHRVYCVGKNYADHVIEMGSDPESDPPFFFQKNPDNLQPGAARIPYPSETKDLHHEIELLVAIGKGGANISEGEAGDHVFGHAVALDMTRRDLQWEMKGKGRPWEVSKAFDKSAPCGPIVPVSETGPMDEAAIWVDVNGERRQSGNINQMIWKTPQVIAYLSRFFELMPGDVILTGTPAGVGPVVAGDVMKGGIDGLGEIEVRID